MLKIRNYFIAFAVVFAISSAYALKGYKGVAHGQQDYAWWWGWAPMVNQLSRVRSQRDMLERVYNIENKLGIGLGGGK